MATLAALQLQQDPKTNGLYDRDFYSWSLQQVEALKGRDFSAIDWDNIIEEIGDLGADRKNLWTKFCARAMEHLLKIEYYKEATDKALRHFVQEIMTFRLDMAELIETNPGLKGHYAEMFAAAWKRGRRLAVASLAAYDESNDPRTTLDNAVRERRRTLPVECPYRLEDVTAFNPRRDRDPRYDIWPPSVARILNSRLDSDFPVSRGRAQDRGGRQR